ncbi:MAG: transposase [Fibrobacteraceae bacterium]
MLNDIDSLYTEDPTRGQRRMWTALYKHYGEKAGRKLVKHLMGKLGIHAIYPRKNLSLLDKQNPKNHYFLHGVEINRVNQVGAWISRKSV